MEAPWLVFFVSFSAMLTLGSSAQQQSRGAGESIHYAARNSLVQRSLAIHFRGRMSPLGHVRAGSVESLLAQCQRLSQRRLRYQYGASKPSSGGLDCSGTVQFLMQKQGLAGVPRQANTQYLWLQKARTLRQVGRGMTQQRLFSELRPGDLLFWEGTYDVQRTPNITHIMVYVGFDRATGKHLMFGASSSKSKGLTGNGVDYFEFKGLKPRGRGRLAGFGRVPGLL